MKHQPEQSPSNSELKRLETAIEEASNLGRWLDLLWYCMTRLPPKRPVQRDRFIKEYPNGKPGKPEIKAEVSPWMIAFMAKFGEGRTSIASTVVRFFSEEGKDKRSLPVGEFLDRIREEIRDICRHLRSLTDVPLTWEGVQLDTIVGDADEEARSDFREKRRLAQKYLVRLQEERRRLRHAAPEPKAAPSVGADRDREKPDAAALPVAGQPEAERHSGAVQPSPVPGARKGISEETARVYRETATFFGDKWFRISEFTRRLPSRASRSPSHIRTWLGAAVNDGFLERKGKNKGTRYRVAQS